MNQITLTIEQLSELLDQQKQATADYLTRNMSIYSAFDVLPTIEREKLRLEIIRETKQSPFANIIKH